jgi:beta-lactamase regulating signal transducer with metallopeptidase domain
VDGDDVACDAPFMTAAEIVSLVGSVGLILALLVTLAVLVHRQSKHQKSPDTAHWDDPGLERSGEERARAKATGYIAGMGP